MEIVVAIKVVPDSQSIIVDPIKKTLNRSQAKSVINPPDRNGIELAISLKEKYGGTVTVITMGPPWAEDQLKEAISMGADNGILITDRYFAGADTYPTSLTVAKTVSKIKFDLVICGEETTDSSTAQVGPGVAEHLKIPQATFIHSLEYQPNEKKILAERLVEGGIEYLSIPLPAVVTASLNMNIVRAPTLKGRIRGKKAVIVKWGLKDIELPKEWVGLSGSPTKVREVKTEESEYREVTILSGSISEIVDNLYAVIEKVDLND
ncbi:MAG: electron transfer flavoprotein subunit beta/FixA family protein [Candidatus Thermoplasmatota archaeon]|jgi:electron transfer flavoprotein beta subunit|nr:electron transfer flavoprotein subunit beta/FixA family protein [Candidatus Thermoplasmatota archaeon]MCL5963292.1 electron transfer flavoprotein subunit beta/FixA family protein [Candidatus Thermoplasmatota archaeon]